MTRQRTSGDDAGIGSVVLLVAVVPFLLLVFFACLLVGARSYAVVRAGLAAQAAAGAVAAGSDPEPAALASLSRRLAATARVELTEQRVSVRVQVLDPWQLGPSWGQVEVSAPVGGEEGP